MAGLAASVVVSMVIDDILKDDGGAEMENSLRGEGYKRRSRHRLTRQKMGGAIAKATIRQAARAAARQVTKKAVKRLAVRGAKGLAKGALTASLGIGTDYAIQEMQGGSRSRSRGRSRVRRVGRRCRRNREDGDEVAVVNGEAENQQPPRRHQRKKTRYKRTLCRTTPW